MLTLYAIWDSYYTPVNTPLTVAAPGVLANDYGYGTGTSLTAIKDTDPTHGTLTLNPDGSFVYTPAKDYLGHDVFTYHFNNGTENSVSNKVYLAMSQPVLRDDAYTIQQGATLTVSAAGVLSNDLDPSGDGLGAFVTAQPYHGTLTFNSNGSFTYKPYNDFSGQDTFTYAVYLPYPIGPGYLDPNTAPKATVTITALRATNYPVSATKGQLFTAKVANFVAANPALTAADFTATIDWGDSQSSAGTVAISPSGGLDVRGSHTYGASGYFPINVTITDPANQTIKINGSWSSAAPMTGYGTTTFTGTDGRIYELSGFQVLAYDPATMSWSTVGSLPTQRGGYAAAMGGDGRIYVFGGEPYLYGGAYDQTKVLDTVEVLDPTSNTWSTAPKMPTARYGAESVRGSDGRIYVIGGAGLDRQGLASVDVFDPATNSWSSAAPMNIGRVDFTAAAGSDGRIYAMSGHARRFEYESFTSVEAYNIATNTWSIVSTVPWDQRSSAGVYSSAAALGRIVAFDGLRLSAFDPGNNTWTSLPTPGGADGLIAAFTDGRIYWLNGGSSYVLSGFALVGGAALRVSVMQVEGTEGMALDGVVASFVDDGAASSRNAVIDWGDGSNSTGTVTARADGGFEVRGQHSYLAAGRFTTTVTVQEGSVSATVVGSAIIHHQPRATGVEVRATEGSTFSGTVATLTDDAGDLAAGFVATIDWGDGGAATAGTVVADGGGNFHVTGSHAYIYAGMYAVHVTVTDSRGNTTTTNGAWSAIPPMPRARIDFSAVTGVDGRIYVIGGTDYSTYPFQPINAVDIYDPVSGAWLAPLTLPGPINSPQATASADGHIYVIGYDAAYTYDPTTNVWATLPVNPSPRLDAAIAAGSDGRIYVIGGTIYPDGYGVPTASVMAYDPVAKSWTAAPSLPFTAYQVSATAGPDGRIYVLAGQYTCRTCVSTSAFAYTPGATSWSVVTDLNQRRVNLATSIGPGNLIYALGGGGTGGFEQPDPVSTAEAYDTVGKTWRDIAPMLMARSQLAAATGGDGRLYALGGYVLPSGMYQSSPSGSVEAYSPGAVISSLPSGVNHPPTFFKGPDVTVANNDGAQAIASWAAGILPGPPAEASQKLTFLVTTDNAGLFQTAPAIDAKGTLSFVPKAGAVGQAEVTIVLKDDGGTANGGVDSSAPQAFTIRVTPAHSHAPSGTDTTITMQEDGSYAFSASDFGFSDVVDSPANAFVAVKIAGLPDKGKLELSGVAVKVGDTIPAASLSSLVYSPPSALYGESPIKAFGAALTTIAFQVQDDGGTADGGSDLDPTPNKITIDVTHRNHAPLARDDSFFIRMNTPNDPFPLSPWGVIANDVDIDGAPDDNNLQALLIRSPAHGQLIWNTSGIFTYTPDADFTGVDSLTYQLDDGEPENHLSNVATVTLHVAASNAPPDQIVVRDESYTTGMNTPLIVGYPGHLANDYSTHGNSLWSMPVFAPDQATADAVQFEVDGSFIYTPPAGFVGETFFVYDVRDNEGVAAQWGTVTLRVTAIGDRPPTAADDVLETLQDQPLTIEQMDLLANDSDPDGDTLVGQLVDPPLHGTLSRSASGGFIYTPAAGYAGSDSFSYVANDGQVDSEPATVRISVVHVNQAPVLCPAGPPDASQGACPPTIPPVSDEDGTVVVAHFFDAFAPGPASESGQHLQFMLQIDHPELFAAAPSVDSSNGLTFAPAPNVHGTAVLTVTVQDDGGTANGGSDTSVFVFPIEIDKIHPWHNSENGADVNDDHVIAPRDVVAIINYINAFGRFNDGKVPAAGTVFANSLPLPPGLPFGYLDANGDGYITAADALLIINEINAHANGAGELPNVDDVLMLLATDLASGAKKKKE